MKVPAPPSDIQFAQLRSAIKAILELPQDGMGAILLIPFAVQNGNDTGLKILTMGVTSDFAADVLRRACDIVAREMPEVAGRMDAAKE